MKKANVLKVRMAAYQKDIDDDAHSGGGDQEARLHQGKQDITLRQPLFHNMRYKSVIGLCEMMMLMVVWWLLVNT